MGDFLLGQGDRPGIDGERGARSPAVSTSGLPLG